MQVNLSWAAVPNALYYRIYRGTLPGGPYLLIAQSNPSASKAALTYQDGPGNLVNGQNYYYRISAVTVDGESAYSTPEIAAVAPNQPASPTGVLAVVT